MNALVRLIWQYTAYCGKHHAGSDTYLGTYVPYVDSV